MVVGGRVRYCTSSRGLVGVHTGHRPRGDAQQQQQAFALLARADRPYTALQGGLACEGRSLATHGTGAPGKDGVPSDSCIFSVLRQ
jgi:hypothetical protein